MNCRIFPNPFARPAQLTLPFPDIDASRKNADSFTLSAGLKTPRVRVRARVLGPDEHTSTQRVWISADVKNGDSCSSVTRLQQHADGQDDNSN